MERSLQPRTRTVLGEPLADGYDLVLAHEHLLIDIRCWLDEDARERDPALVDAAVGPDTLAAVRRNPFACLDNLVLDDEELLLGELAALRAVAGRALVVDVTPETVGRDVGGLAQLSRRSGVDVVYGCGPYIDASWPAGLRGRDSERHAEAIAAQFRALGPGVPVPAVIGEIGTSAPVTPDERAALRGAGMAQALLGVPLYVHVDPWAPQAHEALDLLEAAGADLARVVVCHLDVSVRGSGNGGDGGGLALHQSLLRRGCLVAFDIWGDEYAYGDRGMPTDEQRLAATLELIAAGHGDRLLHAHDVCTKTQLRRFGGRGFTRLSEWLRPRLEQAGLSAAEIHGQLAGNARRLLRG